jgi:hypothetical protein
MIKLTKSTELASLDFLFLEVLFSDVFFFTPDYFERHPEKYPRNLGELSALMSMDFRELQKILIEIHCYEKGLYISFNSLIMLMKECCKDRLVFLNLNKKSYKEALNKNFMLWNFWCFDPQEFWEYVSNYNPYIIILCKDEARSYSAGMYLRQEGYQKSYCFKFLEFNNMKSLLKSIINPLQ